MTIVHGPAWRLQRPFDGELLRAATGAPSAHRTVRAVVRRRVLCEAATLPFALERWLRARDARSCRRRVHALCAHRLLAGRLGTVAGGDRQKGADTKAFGAAARRATG